MTGRRAGTVLPCINDITHRHSSQAAGIRYIGFRNEQSAGYAAAAAGFLTGTPAALLTVSGPGAIHGIAGLSHAAVNCFPLIQVRVCVVH